MGPCLAWVCLVLFPPTTFYPIRFCPMHLWLVKFQQEEVTWMIKGWMFWEVQEVGDHILITSNSGKTNILVYLTKFVLELCSSFFQNVNMLLSCCEVTLQRMARGWVLGWSWFTYLCPYLFLYVWTLSRLCVLFLIFLSQGDLFDQLLLTKPLLLGMLSSMKSPKYMSLFCL